MRKLDQEELEFIDNYLKNSGVEYIDVRLEMLDHVASAVEAKMQAEQTEFYEAFKAYMVVNKKELLKSSTKYSWSVDKKLLVLVCKNLFSFPVVISLFLLGVITYLSEVNKIYWLYSVLVFSPILYIGVPAIIYRKFKYSFLHRFALYAVLINSITNNFFLRSLEGNSSNFYVLIFVFWLNLSIAFSAYHFIKMYKNKMSLT